MGLDESERVFQPVVTGALAGTHVFNREAETRPSIPLDPEDEMPPLDFALL